MLVSYNANGQIDTHRIVYRICLGYVQCDIYALRMVAQSGAHLGSVDSAQVGSNEVYFFFGAQGLFGNAHPKGKRGKDKI